MISPSTLFSAALLVLPLAQSASAQEVAKLHKSTCVVEIHHPEPIDFIAGELSPNYMANQIASLSMGEVIVQAAMELEIEPKVIEDALKVSRIEGTDLVRIWAMTPDAALSKAIVNEIPRTYLNIRNRHERTIIETKLSALEDELTVQGDVISENRKQLTVLIQQYGIPYFEDIDGGMMLGSVESRNYQKLQEELQDLQTQKNLPEAQLAILSNAKPEDLVMTALAIEVPENPVVRSYERQLEVAAELSQKLSSGLPDNDPSEIASKIQLEKSLSDTNNAVESLKHLLQARVDILDRQIELSKAQIDRSQSDTVDLSLKQHKFHQARREYEASQELFRKLANIQQEARVALNMPKTPITIRRKAE